MPSSAARRLLAHYDRTARRLPWRALPGESAPDAYRVWLSEVMLQQTTVATVTPRFERFVSRWPTVGALAGAPAEEVLHEWAGLGYYARARNLHACAKVVAERGRFPRTSAALRDLPGIGEYTAAAVAAIAFGETVAAIDTNVERVVARLHAIEQPVAEIRPELRRLAQSMVPDERPGDFAQAMMDLGATICRPKAPDCGACPLSADCAAFASGRPEAFPAPKVRKARPHRHGIAYWYEMDGAVRLVRRPAKGLLAGMPALPGPAWNDQPPPMVDALATVRHVFTHFSLDLHMVKADGPPPNEGWWQPFVTIGDAGLPTLYRRAIEAVTERV